VFYMNHTIALTSDLAGTNVTGTCLRVKRHGAPVFSTGTVWAFGHVESWQTHCAWAKTLPILIVDTIEKKRKKKSPSTVIYTYSKAVTIQTSFLS
jgi:hypothetical protein